jgi:hypothetical protein
MHFWPPKSGKWFMADNDAEKPGYVELVDLHSASPCCSLVSPMTFMLSVLLFFRLVGLVSLKGTPLGFKWQICTTSPVLETCGWEMPASDSFYACVMMSKRHTI